MDSVRGVFAGDGGEGLEYLTFDPPDNGQSPLGTQADATRGIRGIPVPGNSR